MSIKSLLMPAVTGHMLARERLLARRAKAERRRVASGRPHRVHYFHQVDDPYSALSSSALPELLARYEVELVPHVVGPPADEAAPERDRLVAYSRVDAQRLANRFGLEFHDPGQQPEPERQKQATALLVSAAACDRFVDVSGPVSRALWRGEPPTAGLGLNARSLSPAGPSDVERHLAASGALRRNRGHYLAATFYYAGEWYWGIDRLYHLEQRLRELGIVRPKAEIHDYLFAPPPDVDDALTFTNAPPIDFFFSLRSPYSAIVMPRIFELARRCRAELRLRFVLPMAMRGLPVPRAKRMYIVEDAAREAFVRGVPFGRINDPLGRPVERGLALIPFAKRERKAEAYLLSFMGGVWAEGIDAGSDSGLRKIVERAGLEWRRAREALRDNAWRATAERNRREMLDLGVWGVPSFHVRDLVVWGQDRLWAVSRALSDGCV